METKVRKLPKKTIIYLSILGVLGVVSYFIVNGGQSVTATKIIKLLKYDNVSNVEVFAKHQFLREDTNVKGYKYSISFIDNNTNKECKGFVLQDFKGNVTEDLICKEIKE